MAEIVVHKLYEEKERQYIIDAYENFGKKTARKWKGELMKIQNFLKKYPEGKPPFLGAPKFSYLLRTDKALQGIGRAFEGVRRTG